MRVAEERMRGTQDRRNARERKKHKRIDSKPYALKNISTGIGFLLNPPSLITLPQLITLSSLPTLLSLLKLAALLAPVLPLYPDIKLVSDREDDSLVLGLRRLGDPDDPGVEGKLHAETGLSPSILYA